MNKTLFDYLNSVNAKYPKKDPEYNEQKEEEYLNWVKNDKKNQLENQRLRFLSKDFNPQNYWWGSKITKD